MCVCACVRVCARGFFPSSGIRVRESCVYVRCVCVRAHAHRLGCVCVCTRAPVRKLCVCVCVCVRARQLGCVMDIVTSSKVHANVVRVRVVCVCVRSSISTVAWAVLSPRNQC